jgi:nucleoside-diphosphate-sugar epimerase
MRVIVIGGTGHIGSWLVPRLVEAGHDVVSVTRGHRAPYQPAAWAEIEHAVEHVGIDRSAEEAQGRFGQRIAELDPEVVIDLICYHLDSAVQLVEGLRGRVEHLLHCGTIWVHGPSFNVPTAEGEPRRPFGDYGCRKAAIEQYLMTRSRLDNCPVTVLHPGHLVGPGWAPLNPAGNFNTAVFSDLANTREVRLPNLGMETLNHVHVDDVAQAFVQAIAHRAASIGESFHVVASSGLTFRGYAEQMATWFGREARLVFLPWEAWRIGVPEKDAAATLDHLRHSPCCSIEKAMSLIGYAPRYNPLQAIQESIIWLMQQGVVRQGVDG